MSGFRIKTQKQSTFDRNTKLYWPPSSTELLPTAYVVRREGNVFTRVCPSIHLSVHGGGVLRPGPARGYSCQGYPTSGTPIRPGWGVPLQEYPTSGTPLSDLARGEGGTLPGGTPLRQTDGVLDTPRSVCLLRSRRTFLLKINFTPFHHEIQALFTRTDTEIPQVPVTIGTMLKL